MTSIITGPRFGYKPTYIWCVHYQGGHLDVAACDSDGARREFQNLWRKPPEITKLFQLWRCA